MKETVRHIKVLQKVVDRLWVKFHPVSLPRPYPPSGEGVVTEKTNQPSVFSEDPRPTVSGTGFSFFTDLFLY